MKKFKDLLLVSFLSIVVQTTNAQWTNVYQDANAAFADAAFPTDYTGYVTGNDTGGAFVLRTFNAGLTWDKRYITGWSFNNKIAMSDSLSGYMIKGGVPVQIIRTNNGFNTYTTHFFDSCFVVQALELLNDSTGFYLNNATRLRKFKHYGANYSYVIDTLFDGQNLQFVNSNIGFLDNGDRLLMTNDAGLTWNYVNNNMGFYCTIMKFADSLNGYFSDGGTIYKTNDGGVTFPQQYNFLATSFTVNGNFCMSANNSGDVAYTLDGGNTWQNETTGINVIAPEAYVVKSSPGGNCYLFSPLCGEIRKRQGVVNDISNPITTSDISIYPNPFISSTTISFVEQQNNTRISVTDVLGKEVSSIDFSGRQITIERNELHGGVYFISITDESNSLRRKIIVQ